MRRRFLKPRQTPRSSVHPYPSAPPSNWAMRRCCGRYSKGQPSASPTRVLTPSFSNDCEMILAIKHSSSLAETATLSLGESKMKHRLRAFVMIPAWLFTKLLIPFLPPNHPWKPENRSQPLTLQSWCERGTDFVVEFGIVMWTSTIAGLILLWQLSTHLR